MPAMTLKKEVEDQVIMHKSNSMQQGPWLADLTVLKAKYF